MSLNGTLSRREQRQREILVFANLSAIFVSIAVYMTRSESFAELLSANVAMLINMAANGVLLWRWVFSPYPLSQTNLILYIAVMLGTVMIMDVSAVIQHTTIYPLVVAIVDLVLVLRLPDRLSFVIVAGAVGYVIVVSLERGFRLGIFDIPGLPTQAARVAWCDEACGCKEEELPCRMSSTMVLTDVSVGVLVFVLDFLATRGFSNQVLKEQNIMQHTIDTVASITKLLAVYDLESVQEQLLYAEGHIPEEMHATLTTMELSLRGFLPYLPLSCLGRHDNDDVLTVSTLPSADSFSDCSDAEMDPKIITAHPIASSLCTLVVVNVKGTLQSLALGHLEYATQFGDILQHVVHSVGLERGVVDVFVGDRIMCSFNALRQCVGHASSACHAATSAAAAYYTELSIGIATGNAYCGDLGCDTMRRFSTVGRTHKEACALERAACALGYSVVGNQMLFRETQGVNKVRAIPRLVCLQKVGGGGGGGGEVMEMFEVQPTTRVVVSGSRRSLRGEAAAAAAAASEEATMWQDYNTAVLRYLKNGEPAYPSAHSEATKKSKKLATELEEWKGCGPLVVML